MFWTIIVSCLNLLIYRFKALWIQLIHSKQCKTTTTYWITHTIVRSANRTLDKLNISFKWKTSVLHAELFPATSFVLCKCKCNEHCCRCDEEHHAHGAVAGTNGTVRSDSVTGHFWFLYLCKCTLHEDLHIISVLPNRIEKEWSLAAVASHLGKSCKKFHVEVL